MKCKIVGADAPFEIIWDKLGIAHVWASTVSDAYRGMGYAAAYERLWQIHLSTAYANGEAAALLGERFVRQDAMQRAFNVHGGLTELPSSSGDWIASAYLEGMNAYVDALDEVPPEFQIAGAEPRKFTMRDVAARYRFTSWFQHKSWTEKLMIGRLMATHGVDYFRDHLLHFSKDDEEQIEELKNFLVDIDPKMIELAYPEIEVPGFSGSNNWAISGELSASGRPMLATDPHQPHSIPNTFFYVHLHVEGWDAFGAAFPGVPYFMMGFNNDLAWGLTTGFIDCYDLFVEQVDGEQYLHGEEWKPVVSRKELIAVKGGEDRNIEVKTTHHGVLLEPLMQELGMSHAQVNSNQTSLYWSLRDVPSSAGALGLLPTAKTASEFGDLLFEGGVCPLVNNIICVDKENNIERYIAAVVPVRRGVTGSVPMTGWNLQHDFNLATQSQLTVERNPEAGYSLTANNDTMEERGDFYIHNFPAGSARANRIKQLLDEGSDFTVDQFCDMQLDLLDLRAKEILPDLIELLKASEDALVVRAAGILENWDCQASPDSVGACVFYPFLDRYWQRNYLFEALGDDLFKLLPLAAPGLNRFDLKTFTKDSSPWNQHREILSETVHKEMRVVMERLHDSLGPEENAWRWGDLHQIAFWHRQRKRAGFEHLTVGPDPIGGSPTTLGMAMHMGKGPGRAVEDEIPCRVFHGPAYRLVVDLGDHQHARFVIAGGNGGRPDSKFATNQYGAWLQGDYFTLNLKRDEIDVHEIWQVEG